MNALENLVLFAPLAVAVQVTGSGNEVTAAACAAYFWARLAHAPIYWFNVPWLRTFAYLIGLAACLTLAYQLLT